MAEATDHFIVDGEITELVLAGPEVPDFALHEEEALDGARNLFCRRLKVIFESLQVEGPGASGYDENGTGLGLKLG